MAPDRVEHRGRTTNVAGSGESGARAVVAAEVLPPNLMAGADRAGNGELFWTASVARDAACWLAERQLAIVGGEVYRRHSGAWGSYDRYWATDPGWVVGEAWSAYVRRCLDCAVTEVENDPAEWSAFPFVLSETLYFFGVCTRGDYGLARAAAPSRPDVL